MKIILACTVITVVFSQTLFAQIKISCIGNSITEGFGLQSPSTQSYPARLQSLLGSGYQVENEGVTAKTLLKNGDQPYWTQGKLPQVFAFKPNIITLILGTNDTKPQNWDTHNSEFKRDYLAMVDTLYTLSTKPRIFVVLPVPIWSNTMGIRDTAMQKIIIIIKQVALERGLPVIDCNTPFKQFQAYFRTAYTRTLLVTIQSRTSCTGPLPVHPRSGSSIARTKQPLTACRIGSLCRNATASRQNIRSFFACTV